MAELIPEVIEGVPPISGWESEVERARSRQGAVYLGRSPLRLEGISAAFGIALHMHQPLVFEDGDLRNAPVVGNLQYMMERLHVHGNHDAPAYLSCYSRTADFVRELVDAGRHPRVMLDYSGELLFGLGQMGRHDVLDNLKSVTVN